MDGGDVFAADADGTGVRRIAAADRDAGSALAEPALSADGQRVVHGSVCAGIESCAYPREFLWAVNARDGGARTRVYGCICPGMHVQARGPRWSPDGATVVFQNHVDRTGYDIWAAPADGAGAARVLVAWPGTQSGAVWSPDGASIAFSSSWAPATGWFADGPHVMLVNADGSNPRDLGPGDSPDFSPDGGQLAFARAPRPRAAPQVHTVPLAGGRATQVTRGGQPSLDPAWTPAGTRIAYARGGDIRTVRPNGRHDELLIDGTSASDPAFRQPSTRVTFWDFVAAEFRPELRFDTSERWRPVNVDAFAAERDPATGAMAHRICERDPASGERRCDPFTAVADLALFPGGGAFLDVAGEGDETAYASPHPGCRLDGLRDCDAGPRSALYYRVVPETGGAYRLVDYWWFYRLNDVPDAFPQVFKHEGDWEGVTLAFPAEGQGATFDWAAFSQHGKWFRYLRASLSCDGGGPGSCGSDDAKRGRSVSAFVANNSHANYPERCEERAEGDCLATDSFLYEGGHDGARPWGNNGERTTSLIEFPEPVPWTAGAGGWVTWPGRWGADETSPRSPGAQPHFHDPEAAECASYEGCPGLSSRGRRGIAPVRRGVRAAPSCRRWFGGGVVAVACAPERVDRALARGALRSRSPRLRPVGSRLRTGSAPGLSQALGDPLRPGDRLVLRGPSGAGTELLVRIGTRERADEARFDRVRLPRSELAVLVVDRHAGRPRARLWMAGGRSRAPAEMRTVWRRRTRG